MKIVIQRVKKASVTVDNKVISSINAGLLLLVGIENGDTIEDVKKASEKIHKMRIFEDFEGKMNLDISSINGEILSVSQFTLCADIRKGNRPSFIESMAHESAVSLFDSFNLNLESLGLRVKTGVFQANMQVDLTNDGPVTIIMNVKDGKVI